MKHVLKDSKRKQIGIGSNHSGLNKRVPYAEAIAQEMRVRSNVKYYYTFSGTLDIDVHHSGLDTGLSDNGLHLAGDIVEAVVGGSGYLDGLLHFFYYLGIFAK